MAGNDPSGAGPGQRREQAAEAEGIPRLCLLDLDGKVLTADRIPGLICAAPSRTVLAIMRRHGRESWTSSEVVVSNDPYQGGIDLRTITVSCPGFVEGRLAGFAVAIARHDDIGEMRAAPPTGVAEIVHEGFLMRLLRMRHGIEAFDPTFEAMLMANVRDPTRTLDLLRRQADLARAAAAAWPRHPSPPHAPSGPALEPIAAAAEHATAVSAPAGGSDPPVVRARVVYADKLTVQLDAPPASPDRINCSRTAALSAAACAWSQLREASPIDVVDAITLETAPGSLVDARYPAAVSAGTSTAHACYEATLGALAQLFGTSLERRAITDLRE